MNLEFPLKMDHSVESDPDKPSSIKFTANIKTTIIDFTDYTFEESLGLLPGKLKIYLDSPAHSMEHTIPLLERLAELGSIKAKEYCEALKFCTWVVKTLRKEEDTGKLIVDRTLQEQIVMKLGKAFEIDHLLPEWSPMELLIPMVSISTRVLKKQKSSIISDLDKAVRMCQVHFYSATNSKFNEGLKLVEESIQKYPDVEYFYFMKGILLGSLKKMEEGLKASNEALQKFPKGLLLLKTKAKFLNNLPDVSIGRKYNAYMHFLKEANISERYVPLYWYGICELIATKFLLRPQTIFCKSFTRGLNMLKKAYAKAQIAEIHILPCNINDKLGLLSDIHFVTNVISKAEMQILQLQTEDFQTREMILDIRGFLYGEMNQPRKTYEEDMRKLFNFDFRSFYPKSSSSVSPGTLEPIFLEDMTHYGPIKAYKGRIIKLTCIESPHFVVSSSTNLSSMTLIVEDITGDIAQCHIVNYKKTDDTSDAEERVEENIQKCFGIGCKFSICNPEYCDLVFENRWRRKLIVVNGTCPNSIVLHPEERIECLCSYCGIEISPRGKALRCDKCKKAFYCDSHCQKRDWKVFGHKGFCKKMATCPF